MRASLAAGLTVYSVRTRAEGKPVTGMEAMIVRVPAGVYVAGLGGPVLHVRRLGAALRQFSLTGAAGVGEELHHAQWVITQDLAVIEDVGMHGYPGCVSCRAMVDKALTDVATNHQDLLVGELYWAGS